MFDDHLTKERRKQTADQQKRRNILTDDIALTLLVLFLVIIGFSGLSAL